MEIEETSIETLVVVPVRENRYRYQINQGKEHICNQDSLKNLIFPLIPYEQKPAILDLLFRIRSFVIIIDEEMVLIREIFPTSTSDKQMKMGRKALLSRKNAEKSRKSSKKKSKEQLLDKDVNDLFDKSKKEF